MKLDHTKHLNRQLAERGEYNRLAKHAKRRWTTLLQYNEVDCRAMQALVLAAVVRSCTAHSPSPGSPSTRR
jgi:hypothetical protein